MIPVLLDTDIGTNVDDALALGALLASSEVSLAGVTTVYGDVGRRAQIARKLLDLAGAADVPVAAGEAQPIRSSWPEIYATGAEGRGVLTFDERDPAVPAKSGVDLLIEIARHEAGDLVVIAIGALTNLARALERDPALPRLVRRLVVMAGALDERRRESNVCRDVEAARRVLRAGFRLLLVPKEVCEHARLDEALMSALRQSRTLVGEQLATLCRVYLRDVLGAGRRREAYLNDPLAVAAAIDPGIVVRDSRAAPAVLDNGRLAWGAEEASPEGPAGEATRWREHLEYAREVRAEKFTRWLSDRYTRGLAARPRRAICAVAGGHPREARLIGALGAEAARRGLSVLAPAGEEAAEAARAAVEAYRQRNETPGVRAVLLIFRGQRAAIGTATMLFVEEEPDSAAGTLLRLADALVVFGPLRAAQTRAAHPPTPLPLILPIHGGPEASRAAPDGWNDVESRLSHLSDGEAATAILDFIGARLTRSSSR